MSASSTDRGLLTPDNCAVIFIDHQPEMFSGVTGFDRRTLLNNVLILAKAARIFSVPVIATTSCNGNAGILAPLLQEMFPETHVIVRTSMNSWDCREFVDAVKKTRRKNFLLSAVWSEACLTFPALQMLEEGFAIYAVEDASGGLSEAAHNAAIRRIEQAGAVSVTALQVLLELQRDWARKEHVAEVMAVVNEHCHAAGAMS